MEKNQFRLADVILSVICVVFVAEAAAPVASIGNSQYFWWIFMILAFLLPYGLIAAELGTAYAGDGGLYDWIHAAYPNGKWAARASWYYWINFPLWMASLAVMCPELITFITGRSLGTFGSLVVELLFIWIVTLIACYPVCDSIIILNVSAVIKIVLALLVGGLGVWYISRYGFVNDMSARTFLPSFDLNSLSYISVIIFNMLGWVNTPSPIIVPAWCAKPLFIFMIMQFIEGIPRDLDEAANMDGCSPYTIFTRIMVPLVKPAMVTCAIFEFYWKWDDYMGSLLYLNAPEKYTVSIALKNFTDPMSSSDYGAMFAMCVLSLLPVIIIFMLLQKYIVEGVASTGIKG